jgi:hypothetical protein
MTEHRFDTLAKLVAKPASRRGVLKAAVGTAVGAKLGLPEVRARPALAQALPDAFQIEPGSYFENVAKVLPPGPSNPEWRVVASLGSAKDNVIARRFLDGAGLLDLSSTSQATKLPITSTQQTNTDNMLVRHRDGDLIALRESCIWTDLTSPPVWFGEQQVRCHGVAQAQVRGAVLVFTSSDGVNWSQTGLIDTAVSFGGIYAAPRPASCPAGTTVADCAANNKYTADVDPTNQTDDGAGNLLWWMGSGDRPELYACPFTGNLYLTLRVKSGPYKSSMAAQDTMLLLMSRDKGVNWNLVMDTLPSCSPIVMTSTPDGRLFLFEVCDVPTIYFSLTPVEPNVLPVMSPGYPVFYDENGASIPAGLDYNPQTKKGPDPATGTPADPGWEALPAQRCFTPALGISRVSTDNSTSKIRVAYQSLNASMRQEYRILTVEVQDPNQGPITKPVRTIRSPDPENYSVFFGSFIEPDYVDQPLESPSNLSLFYWLDVPRNDVAAKAYGVRGMFFENDFDSGCPFYLSTSGGAPATWPEVHDIGDYMVGSFYWTDNTLNYLPQWSQPTALHANIVSVPYRPPAGYGDTNVTAVWEQSTEGEIHVVGWAAEDYAAYDQELANQGWRQKSLDAHVVAGSVRYTATWRPGDWAEQGALAVPDADFRALDVELWNQSQRLQTLAAFVIDEQVFYSGVWAAGTIDEVSDYGLIVDDFLPRCIEMYNQGWRLEIVTAFALADGLHYTGIWRPGDWDELGFFGVTYDEYAAKFEELWPQGWRLHLLTTASVNGTTLYGGTWRATGQQQLHSYELAYPDFKRAQDELYCAGWRLKTLVTS